MREWYSSEAVRALDAQLIASGVPGIELMERVGTRMAEEIRSRFVCDGDLPSFGVLAGGGNNAGDGFVIARCLVNCGCDVSVLMAKPVEKLSPDAAVNFERMEELGVHVLCSVDLDDGELQEWFGLHDYVVDALLGTGAHGMPRGETGRLIRAVNECVSPSCVIAVDMPSGLEGDGECVRASLTLTAGAFKTALASGRGRGCSGELVLIPLDKRAPDLLGDCDLVTPGMFSLLESFPVRHPEDHKGSRGGVLIIAGSSEYRGAPLLAARGALRAGAGFVVVASTAKVVDSLAVSLPEAIGEVLNDASELPALFERWKNRCATLLIGPGLGRNRRAMELCRAAPSLWKGRSVWDGDALFFMATDESVRPAECVITPHEGEAARLTGGSTPLTDRVDTVRRLTGFGTAVLKGYGTLVAESGHTPRLLECGNRVLGVPGSGDVLAGAIAAFSSACRSLYDAAVCGVMCHGRAGELLSRSRGEDGVLASEVADALPEVLHALDSQIRC